MNNSSKQHANSTPSASARPRALVMTVGIPADPKMDIAGALVDEARSLEPVELVLLASSQSYRNALRIAELLGKSEGECDIIKLESSHDLDEAFRKVNAAIERLEKKGIAPEEVAVNFTSGTKIMGSAAVLSAVFNRCMELRYLTGAEAGARRGKVVRAQPGAVYAYQDLLRGRNLILQLHFGSAEPFLAGINDVLLNDGGREFRVDLMHIATAYHEREAFRPDRFLAQYKSIRFSSPLMEAFKMSAAQLEATHSLVEESDSGKVGGHVLIDLYDNGIRRLNSGAPDDAAIRLYRAMEVLAQWILRRDFEIDTNDVDTRRIPPRDRVGFEALRSMEDGMVKIGLRKAFDLLVILGTRVGVQFKGSAFLHEYLTKRADSILAHGLGPIDSEDARTFFRAARDLFLVEIEDFDERCRLLQFPWLSAEADAISGPANARASAGPSAEIVKGT